MVNQNDIFTGKYASVSAYGKIWKVGFIIPYGYDSYGENHYRIILSEISATQVVYVPSKYTDDFINERSVESNIGTLRNYCNPSVKVAPKVDVKWLPVIMGAVDSVTVNGVTYEVAAPNRTHRIVISKSQFTNLPCTNAKFHHPCLFVSDGFTKEFMEGGLNHITDLVSAYCNNDPDAVKYLRIGEYYKSMPSWDDEYQDLNEDGEDEDSESDIDDEQESDEVWLDVLRGNLDSVVVGGIEYKVGKLANPYCAVYRIIISNNGTDCVYVSDGFTKEFVNGDYVHHAVLPHQFPHYLRKGTLEGSIISRYAKVDVKDGEGKYYRTITCGELNKINNALPTPTKIRPYTNFELLDLLGKHVVAKDNKSRFIITAVNVIGHVYIYDKLFNAQELYERFTYIDGSALGVTSND